MSKKLNLTLFLLRVSLGWIFLWAFVDKVWGLEFTTKASDAWLAGGSPTSGFLMFATKGPFREMFKSLAGNSFVDVLFMAALLGIGASLLLGVAARLRTYTGVSLMVLMYTSIMPPEHNPLIDEHIIYIFSLLLLYYLGADNIFGMGNWWRNSKIVKKIPVLG